MVPPITDRTWPIVPHAHMYMHTCKLELRLHLDSGFRPQSYQTFCLVLALKLLEIMLRNRCWFTTFHTITTGDAEGWC